MKRLALVALLTLASAQAGAATSPAPQPVLVEFGGLLWVQSADGLPYLKNGQIVAPLLPLCDLFGAKCTPDWAKGTVQVQQKGQPVSTVPIAETGQRGTTKLAFVNLQALSGPLGYAVTWLPDARRADVERVRKIPGGLSWIQGDVAGVGLKLTRLSASVQVRTQPLTGYTSWQRLFISSPSVAPSALWPFLRDGSGNPGRASTQDCVRKNGSVCTLGTERTWRYTLAYVELKKSAWK